MKTKTVINYSLNATGVLCILLAFYRLVVISFYGLFVEATVIWNDIAGILAWCMLAAWTLTYARFHSKPYRLAYEFTTMRILSFVCSAVCLFRLVTVFIYLFQRMLSDSSLVTLIYVMGEVFVWFFLAIFFAYYGKRNRKGKKDGDVKVKTL